jgi:hypothetical protein
MTTPTEKEMTNCPKQFCKYKGNDCSEEVIRSFCKIYLRYKAQHDLDKEYKNEQLRHIQENDIGLLRLIK